MPAILRFYVAHERAILGALMVVLFLVAWEGLERGWWARLLHPLLGAVGGALAAQADLHLLADAGRRRPPSACSS